MGLRKTWQILISILIFLCIFIWFAWEGLFNHPNTIASVLCLLGSCSSLLLLIFTSLTFFKLTFGKSRHF